MKVIKSNQRAALNGWRKAVDDEYIDAAGTTQRMAVYDEESTERVVYLAFGDDRLDFGFLEYAGGNTEYEDMDFSNSNAKMNSNKVKSLLSKMKVPMIDASLFIWVVTGLEEKLFTKL